MEELWQNNNRGRTRGFLQWKREKTRAWREHCHEMSPSLQQAHHHPPEGSPFQHYNIIVQAYSPISDYDGNEIEESCDQLQNVIDQTQKKDILLVQGDWNAKVGRDACGNWQGICGPFCNDDTNERGFRHLEFAIFNDLVFGEHIWSSQGIQKLDMAQPKWTTPQPD